MNSCQYNDSILSIFIGSNVFTSMQISHNSLAQIRLTQEAKMRVGSYSGGMKRRLSVAIALIGDPKLVIMDEPVCRLETSPFCMFL